MFRLNRNERSHWSGNGVHVESELVFMIGRNMHLSAGHHQLVIEGKPKAGGDAVQQTLDLMFKDPASGGDYQFTFPDGLKSYTAGTRVLQPKNGKVYQCKPFPYSGWCSQWASTATQYEPGVGSHWQEAWTAQ